MNIDWIDTLIGLAAGGGLMGIFTIPSAIKKAKAEAKEDATKFLITDKVFKEFKKELGNATYRVWEEQYGEMNIRLSLQCNRLFYYLTSTNLEFNEHEGHSEIQYTADGQYIDFRTVKYTIKADAE